VPAAATNRAAAARRLSPLCPPQHHTNQTQPRAGRIHSAQRAPAAAASGDVTRPSSWPASCGIEEVKFKFANAIKSTLI
jgi:hypothetical protein